MALGGGGGGGGGLSVGQFKGSFFDAAPVLAAMDKKTRQTFSKYGAYTRRSAKSSLRYRKAPSAVGSPPSAHRTQTRKKTNKKGITKTQQVSPLRELVFFAYDADKQSVVIGPALSQRSRSRNAGVPVGNTVPGTLEAGGRVSVRDRQRRPKGLPRGAVLPERRKTVSVGARPFMGPAGEANRGVLMDGYKGGF